MFTKCKCYTFDETFNDHLYELRGTYLQKNGEYGNTVTDSFPTTAMLIIYEEPELPARTLSCKVQTSCILADKGKYLEWWDTEKYDPDDYEEFGSVYMKM